MDVALLAATVLDQRAAAQAAELTLMPFMRKRWSAEQRAKFVKAAQAITDATDQPLTTAAEIVLQQMEGWKTKERKRSS
jgi:hypothetical protein